MIYLNKEYSLCDLLDKVNNSPPFSILEREIVINEDNLTFGPKQLTLLLTKRQNKIKTIVYYCLLYFVFEAPQTEHSTTIYEKILQFILEHDMSMKDY